MKVLITGAFGNLGLMCVRQAIAMGFEVRCFDLDSPANRKQAEAFEQRVEVVLGDLQDVSLHAQLVLGVDAIIHNASLLPPMTETHAALAHEINVTACKRLIHAAEQNDIKPLFVFPSSVTVFGMATVGEGELSAQDPVKPSDNYTQQKVMIEEYLQESVLPWVVMRVGVSVDARTLKTDRKTFKQLLDVKADNPLEYVHPEDVALAMCRACEVEAARNKVLLIGGGKSCQITQHHFLNTAFNAAGLNLPASAHGPNAFYTHWMDTRESQELLQFQSRDFSFYQQQMRDKLRPVRFFLKPLSFLINPLLLLLLSLL